MLRGRPRLIPDPSRKSSSFSPLGTMAAVRPVWVDVHYQVDEYSSSKGVEVIDLLSIKPVLHPFNKPCAV